MEVTNEKIEIIKSRTYVLDQHDVEVVDAFCKTILRPTEKQPFNKEQQIISAAKGLAKMLYGNDDMTLPENDEMIGPPAEESDCMYTVRIVDVAPTASMVFKEGRAWRTRSSTIKATLLDILSPWCKVQVTNK